MPNHYLALWTSIDHIAFWSDILKSLIVAAITGFIAVIFTKKYISKITFANELSKYGFLSSISNKNITEKEYRYIFSHAHTIKLIFVTGIGFFSDIKKQEMIKKALARGAKIEILLSRKNNPFLKDIKNMEHEFSYRSFEDNIDLEVDRVHEILENLNRGSKNKLQVRYFSSEYRLPLVIASFDENSPKAKTSVWLNITLPPAKAKEHILFRMDCQTAALQQENDNFVYMLTEHFNTVWNISPSWENTAEVYWAEKYKHALQTQVADPKRVLIQISAQHPLVNGDTPNEEFCSRLNAGIALYHELKEHGKQVKFYIPGSTHAENGQLDALPLSEAGKNYLLAQNIPATDIYANDMNIKYKGNDGVYNSADECYVCAKIYIDEGFEELHCFCSPLQVLKNQLFFIENGILAKIYSIPAKNYYHNPFFEAGVMIPEIVFYDHSWQGNSYYGMKSRKDRMPK